MKLPILPVGGIFTKVASVLGVVIVVTYRLFQVLDKKMEESIEACAPGCEVGGPIRDIPEFFLVIGGVLVASFVFVACAQIAGSRRGSV